MTVAASSGGYVGRPVTSGQRTIGTVTDVLVDDSGCPVGFEIALPGGETRFLARHAGCDAADGAIAVESELVLFPHDAIGFYEARGARRLGSPLGRPISV